MSESTVGRILADLMRRGMVLRYAATTKPARKRRFTGHAQRWSYGLLPKAPGEMVQIDHMTVTRNDVAFKPFQARDPMTKYTHADVYHLAEIRDFLKKATRTYNH